MLSLLSPWPWLALALSGVFGLWQGYGLGNRLGPNARLVADIQQQLAKTNSELVAIKAEDERAHAAEEVARERAANAAGNIKACPVLKADVPLINAVGKE
jgi:hypothetical protein